MIRRGVVHVTRLGSGVELRLDRFDRLAVEAIKNAKRPGCAAAWDPKARTWRIPEELEKNVFIALRGLGFDIEEVR